MSEDENQVQSSLELAGLLTTTKIVYMLGRNTHMLALCLKILFDFDRKVVVMSSQDFSQFLCNTIYVTIDIVRDVTFYLVDDFGFEKWNIGMFTSGSTNKSRLYAFTKEQIRKTLSWYKEIYRPTDNTLIMTPLPPAYSFTYIAGMLNAYECGATYKYVSDTKVVSTIDELRNKYDKIILLANPVILDRLSTKQYDVSSRAYVMIDSGGASLSTKAIRHYRNMGFDLREGYGLAETCSLSTFDIEGTDASIGTVGRSLDGVRVNLIQHDNNSLVEISAENIGFPITVNGMRLAETITIYQTTDIGRLQDGRLTILGRYTDHEIHGYYPKDSLELISDIIGAKCALIQHPGNNKVFVELYDPSLLSHSKEIQLILSEQLSIPPHNITVTAERKLLKSMKQIRKKFYYE